MAKVVRQERTGYRVVENIDFNRELQVVLEEINMNLVLPPKVLSGHVGAHGIALRDAQVPGHARWYLQCMGARVAQVDLKDR